MRMLVIDNERLRPTWPGALRVQGHVIEQIGDGEKAWFVGISRTMT